MKLRLDFQFDQSETPEWQGAKFVHAYFLGPHGSHTFCTLRLDFIHFIVELNDRLSKLIFQNYAKRGRYFLETKSGHQYRVF